MKLFRSFILAFFAVALIACGGAEERKSVYMEKAKVSIDAGDFDKARIELKNVLQIDPKDGEAYFQLGQVYEQQKDYRKAYGNYLKAAELRPDLLQNHARLGRFYLLLMNDADKAQEKVTLILSKEPNNSDGLLLKAALMLRNKKTAEATKIAQMIVAQNPAHSDSVAFLSALYVNDNKLTEAIKILDTALKTNSNNQRLNRLLAAALVANKEFKRAEMLYKDFLNRKPNISSNYNNLAAFYDQIGKKGKAEDVLRASVDNDPEDEARILLLVKYIKEINGYDKAINELINFISKNEKAGELRTALAELYILKGDRKSAIETYRQAINDFSEEVTGVVSRTALASMYTREGKWDKASEVVEDALKVSPNDPQVNYLKAKLAVRENDMDQAIISLRIVTKEMPENIDAFLLLARVYQQQKNVEQVKRTLNNAFENNRINTDALLKLTKYYLPRDIAQAEKTIDAYNKIKDADYSGLSLKAAILNKNKKQKEAYEIAKKLIKLYPDKPNGYLQAVPYYGQLGDKEKVISILENGYISAKDNRELLIMLTSFQVAEKKYEVAINRINSELKAAPKDADLKLLLAKVYLAKKDFDDATRLLLEVVESDPSLEDPYLLLAELYLKKSDIVSAEAILEKGEKNVEGSIKTPLKLAALYESKKDYKKAINVYRTIYETQPDNLIVINNLASMLSDFSYNKKDLELAKSLADKLEEAGGVVFLDTIGWVHYKLGDYQKAVKYLSQVVEKAPKINVFNYHLGMSYVMLGDKKQAKLYLEKSLANGKKFKEKDLAKAALKDL